MTIATVVHHRRYVIATIVIATDTTTIGTANATRTIVYVTTAGGTIVIAAIAEIGVATYRRRGREDLVTSTPTHITAAAVDAALTPTIQEARPRRTKWWFMANMVAITIVTTTQMTDDAVIAMTGVASTLRV